MRSSSSLTFSAMGMAMGAREDASPEASGVCLSTATGFATGALALGASEACFPKALSLFSTMLENDNTWNPPKGSKGQKPKARKNPPYDPRLLPPINA